MALAPGGRAPYAPFKTVQTVILRHRQVGLPRVDVEILERIGVTEPLRPRTLASLKLLGFYDDEGKITPEFDHLQRVPEAVFTEHLGQLLRSAYAPVIEIIGEPSAADPQTVEDAFRTFEPRGQLVRMVQLFVGLMTLAGLMSEDSRRRPGPKVARRPSRPRVTNGARPNQITEAEESPVAAPPAVTPPSKGHTVTLSLGAAGSVSLTVDVNPLLLRKSDREFVFSLVDQVEDWRSTQESAKAEESDM